MAQKCQPTFSKTFEQPPATARTRSRSPLKNILKAKDNKKTLPRGSSETDRGEFCCDYRILKP